MNPSLRSVFDTGTLVSAVLRPSSPAAHGLSLAVQSGVVCVSEPSLELLRSVMSQSKFDRYMGRRARMAFVDTLRRIGWMCRLSKEEIAGIRPKGLPRRIGIVFALAAVAEADVVICSEGSLLARKIFRRIPIVSPAEFAAMYDPAQGLALSLTNSRWAPAL